jgi:UDP-glucose 4-epimerase
MNLIIFGGAGFLGSHVADHFFKKKYQIFIFDKNQGNFFNQKYNFIKGDITDKIKVLKSVKGMDLVINFAGISDLNYAINNPYETIEQNIYGNLNILWASKINKVKKFIYASSVYADSEEGGFYKSSKLAAESYIKEFSKFHNLSYIILRYGSIYGPRSDKSNGIYNILFNIIKNQKLIYFGNPETIREYIHVVDAARATHEVIKKNFKNKTITLTGKTPIKMRDLLILIGEIINLKNKSNL